MFCAKEFGLSLELQWRITFIGAAI